MNNTPPPPVENTATGQDSLFCANHPNVPTALRCNRCGKPICNRCAILTPVGYRCKECVRGQQAIFFTATPVDYVLVAVVSLFLGLVGGFIAYLISGINLFGLFLLFFAGPIAGATIADMAHRVAGRRRGRYTWLVVCGAIVLGALPFALGETLLILLFGLFGQVPGGQLGPALLAGGFRPLIMLLYIALAVGAAYGRLRMGR